MFQSIRSAIKSRSFHRKLKHSTPQSLAEDLSKDWNDGLVHAQQVLGDGKPIDMGDRGLRLGGELWPPLMALSGIRIGWWFLLGLDRPVPCQEHEDDVYVYGRRRLA